MANNSTPKLKVYRLDNSNYNESRDNDIKSMTDDEMIPVVSKELNPFNTEEMVGVVARQDARLVRESTYSYARMVEVEESANGYIETTGKLLCDGWVLGKGNFHVYVHRLATGGTDNFTTTGSATAPETAFTYDGTNVIDTVDIFNPVSEEGETVTLKNLKDSERPSTDLTDDGKWIELDRRFWDYTVTTEKAYLDGDNGYGFGSPSAGYKIHNVDCITFRIGNMLFNGDRFFSNEYDQYVSIVGEEYSKEAIIIVYKKYCELGGYFTGDSSSSSSSESSSSSSISSRFEDYLSVVNAGDNGSIVGDSSAYRVPFGNIYNGNKNGRAINKGTGGSPSIVNLLDGNESANKNEMNYYEGNYHYRKKVYPFRVKVLQQDGVTSEFVCDESVTDACRIINGKASVPCELSWFMDDIMKPVVFERMPVDVGTTDERLIFKKLTKNQVTIQYQSTNGDHYAVTLSSKYYVIENTYPYPEELFLAYNYNDDSLGNLFDFNYDYTSENFITRSQSIGYGYANNGIVSASAYNGSNGTEIYLKRDILVSTTGCPMHDTARDLVMTNDAIDTISFAIPSETPGFTANEDDTDAEKIEKARIANGITNIDTSLGMRLYYKGMKIWDSSESSSSSSSESSSSSSTGLTATIDIGGNTCSLTFADNIFTITKDSSSEDAIDFSFIVELMLVYYEKRDMGFAASGGGNPYCIGIRIPCYEKAKTSKLFVSSFPNWVKGHVNNDLDVFYGNKLYSGTEVVGSGLDDYHDIYPEYVKDGWYAMYAEGAIEFNEEKTEWDYFDVLNYGSLISGDVSAEEWSFASTWNAYADDEYIGLMPNYWAEAKKRALLYKKVKYNVARYDGIYSAMRGRMFNVSNATGESIYALVEDDDFADCGDKRWLVRNDDFLRRVFESGREELPIIINVDNTETPELLADTSLRNGDIAILGTDSYRISVLSIPGESHVILLVDSHQNQFQNNATAENIEDMTRIHVKVTGDSDETRNCLAIGLETSTTFEGTDSLVLFDEDATIVNWVYLPDNEDTFIGEVNEYGDSYVGIGIESVQTKEITIDSENRTYWYADETESAAKSLPPEGIAPLYKNEDDTIDYSKGTVRRYRYRNHEDPNWGYDIFFEVFSYRYSSSTPYNGIMNTPLSFVEIVAYRTLAE